MVSFVLSNVLAVPNMAYVFAQLFRDDILVRRRRGRKTSSDKMVERPTHGAERRPFWMGGRHVLQVGFVKNDREIAIVNHRRGAKKKQRVIQRESPPPEKNPQYYTVASNAPPDVKLKSCLAPQHLNSSVCRSDT